MNKQEVIDLMKTSKNGNEWDQNCAKIKAAFGNAYPDYWYSEFISSGLMNKILNNPDADKITLRTF